MATSIQNLFNTLNAIDFAANNPLPAPVVTFEKQEMVDGWYLYRVVNGLRVRMIGAYNRNNRFISVFDAGANWYNLEGRHTEAEAEVTLLTLGEEMN